MLTLPPLFPIYSKLYLSKLLYAYSGYLSLSFLSFSLPLLIYCFSLSIYSCRLIKTISHYPSFTKLTVTNTLSYSFSFQTALFPPFPLLTQTIHRFIILYFLLSISFHYSVSYSVSCSLSRTFPLNVPILSVGTIPLNTILYPSQTI